MAEGVRDVKLGRLGLATLSNDLQEGVGDTLTVTGAAVALGERRPKKYSLNLPVHGTSTDTDPYAVGYRMRRQVRAMMENARLRSEGVYMRANADVEQNGWLLLGGGTLQYNDGGVSLAEFQLTLDDAYRVGSLRTHRAARRVELYDRRLATTPRDWLGQVFGTDYAGVTALAITYLPVGVTDVIGASKVPVQYGTRAGLAGGTPVLVGRTHGEVINYEQPEASMHGWDDVVVWERNGQPDPPGGAAATTLSLRPMLYLRLGDAPGSTTAVDSSDNLFNGTYIGAALLGAPSLLAGDPADTSVGLDQAQAIYARVPDNTTLRLTGNMSLRIKVNPRTGLTGIQGLIGKAASAVRGWRWGWDPAIGEMVANLEPDNGLTLTVSGNEITDAVRAVNTQGDGRLNDSSFGIYNGSTNNAINGGFETNTNNWTVSIGDMTITRDTSRSKFGIACGRLDVTGTTNPFNYDAFFSISGATAGRTFTHSLYVYGEGTSIGKTWQVGIQEQGGASGIGTTVQTFVVQPGWQRVQVTRTATQNDRTGIQSYIQWAGTGVPVAVGDKLWVDGAQVEEQRVATPYIHTDGAVATRAQARVRAPATLINATQSWVAMRVRMGWPSTAPPMGGTGVPIMFQWGAFPNWIAMFYAEGATQFEVARDNTVDRVDVSVPKAVALGELVTVIAAWESGRIRISLNGAPFINQAHAFIPTIADTTFDIGTNQGSSSNGFNSDTLWFACGTGVLTDADAAAINTASVQGDLLPYRLPSTGVPTAVWTADTAVYDVPARWAASIGANITPGVASELAMVYTAAAGSVQFYKNGVALNAAGGLPTALATNTRQLTVGRWESDA